MPVLSSYVCDHAITTMQEFKNSSPVDYLTLSPHVMLITAMNSTQKSGNSITAYHYHWVVVMEFLPKVREGRGGRTRSRASSFCMM